MDRLAGLVMFVVIGLLGIVIYFAPTIVAKGKPHVTGVFLVNLLFGWTVIGWVAAFIWAFTGAPPSEFVCPKCRAGVDPRAVVCPHCRSEMLPVRRHGAPPVQRIDAPPSAASLLEQLRSHDPMVRHEAIIALGDRGAASRDAEGALRALLNDPASYNRSRAKWALETIARESRG
jgi:hypothetical protein